MQYVYTNKIFRFIAGTVDFLGGLLFWKKEPNFDHVHTIVIVKLDHLGDCFLMTPFLGYLAKKFPKAVLDVVCLESSVPIF